MKAFTTVFAFFIFGFLHAQKIELSGGIYGITQFNSINFETETNTEFEPSPPPKLFGIHYSQSYGDSIFNVDFLEASWGIGVQLTQHQGTWKEVVGDVLASACLYRFEADLTTVGLQITPARVTLWDQLDIQTGLYLGFRVADNYNNSRACSTSDTLSNGTVLWSYGIQESYPVTKRPNYIVNLNTRIAYNWNLKSFSLSPFYQYSQSVRNEGGSLSTAEIRSARHHFGLSLGYRFHAE